MVKQENKSSFYKSFRPLLIFGQFIGLIPVKGIFGPNYKHLQFTMKNPQFLYIVIVFGFTCFLDYVCSVENMKQGIKIDNMVPTAFYTVCLMNTIWFTDLAKKLPGICLDFARLEKAMAEYPKSLGNQILIVLLLFVLLSILEHGTMTLLNMMWAVNWTSNEKIGLWEAFYRVHFSTVSRYIPYSGFGLFFTYWMNVTCTLSWNYLDFFLIAISMEISSRLQIVNDRLSDVNSKNKNPSFWEKARLDYNRISGLTRKLNKILSKFIVASYFSNLFHLSLQLTRTLKLKGTVFQKIYFYFSLSYLILRLITVSYCAAKIHDEGKKPVDVLYSVRQPSTQSNRFLHQVLTDDVAFTGFRFFTINRTFIVTIFGTMMTYEVALLQLNSLKETS